ncbi:MAG: FtsX-like permease family protein [Lachnospiraceae bacterium]|jgi:putative ABC transport system permease protein|nr:FtsX-like permease family protein [Lachnospiraceae bacterium]
MNNKKITAKMISLMSKQSLKSSRMRNLFVMITIVLASALLTTILMFAMRQKQQVKNNLSHRQQVGYYNLTNEQVEMLKADDRIAYQIQAKTGILSQMDGFDVMPYYVSELSDKIQIGELREGKLPEKEDEVAAQAAMLKKMGVEPGVGSSVTFTFYDGSTETFRVSGILNGSDTVKQFSVFFSENYAQNGSQLKDMPYEVYAKLYGATTMHPEDCKEAMYLIGSDAGIERKYVSPSKSFIESLSVDTQSVMVYGMVGAVILLACILVIYGVFYLSVIGRIHQFGQLCTIGMTKKQMKRFVSREGGVLYLRSAPIGILIGGIAGYFIIPDGFNIVNTLLIIALVFSVIYVITMISVRKPARLAAAVSPMEALRYVPQDGMKKGANKKLCRKLSPVGLGMMNFSKNRKKATVTMLSLALGGILFMTAATYMSSFDKENYARQGYFVDAEFHIGYAQSAIELNENGMSGIQAEMPLNDEMVQEISALDGVEKVMEIKSFGIRFDYPKNDEYGNDDIIYPLSGEETREIGKYLEDGSADYDKLMSGNYILVAGNGNAAEIYGWEFTVGDTIILHYYDGSKMTEKEVTILGVLNDKYVLDHEGLEGWFLMPEQAVLNWLAYDCLNAHLLVSTGADKEEWVGKALTEMLEEKSKLYLETFADRKVAYEQTANQMFGAISGLAIFIMMFSILSMMNTLITNIVTRKQELAMLESIGMSKVQIRRMLLGESLLLVLATVGVTVTIGTLSGYILSNVLYNMGAFYMAFKFPVSFALIYAGILIIVPLLITFVSMQSFSKEALVERLRGMEN